MPLPRLPKPRPRPSDEKADDNNPAAEFTKLFGEWKQTLGKLYQLRNRFQKDPSADKKALEAEYNALMKQALAMTEPLSDAAEKAYLAAPNTNKELDDFMIKTLTGLVVGDEYEKACRLVQDVVGQQARAQRLSTCWPAWPISR